MVIDLVLLAVIAVSALLGLLRGFVGIVVGTASWLLAGWATFRFGAEAGHWLAQGRTPSATQYVCGYALVFVGVMVAVALLGMLIRAAVDATRLTGADRALGSALGIVRGALLACVLVLLMGFTPLPQEPAWRQSRLLPWLLPLAAWMREQLPEPSAPEMHGLVPHLGKRPATGDNARADESLSDQAVREVVGRVLQPSATGNGAGHAPASSGALPANIEPEQEGSGSHDPQRIEPPGQARPIHQ